MFTNRFGQVIKPGDQVIAVVSGYSHNVSIREATFVGLSSSGSPQIKWTKQRSVWMNDRDEVCRWYHGAKHGYATSEVVTTLQLGRIFLKV